MLLKYLNLVARNVSFVILTITVLHYCSTCTFNVTIAVTGVYEFTITVELQKSSKLCCFDKFSYLFVKKQNNLAICIDASSHITPMASTWQGMSIFKWSIASLLLETICPVVL